MTEPINLYDVALEGNPADPPGYRKRMAELGPSMGAERLGGSVYEVDPGDSVYPYHYEGVGEEWLLVLAGTPTLRDPEGERELAPGDVVCFLAGPDGAHKVTNRSNAVARMDHFARDSNGSRFVWFRMIVTQSLIDVHRRHLGSLKRDAKREQNQHGGWDASSTSCSLAERLLGSLTSPSQALLRAELAAQLDAALATLSSLDQEVLALRHFEELSNSETAEVLKLSEQAASIRYVRALTRLKHVLRRLPAFAEFEGTLSEGDSGTGPR